MVLPWLKPVCASYSSAVTAEQVRRAVILPRTLPRPVTDKPTRNNATATLDSTMALSDLTAWHSTFRTCWMVYLAV